MIRLFQVFIPKSIIALVLCDALLVFGCMVAGTYFFFGTDAELYLFYEDGLPKLMVPVVTVVLSLYFQNLYSDFRAPSRLALVQPVLLAIGMVFLMQALLAYIARDLILSRFILVAAAGGLLVLFPLWRYAYTHSIYKGFGVDRLLFLGSDLIARDIVQCIGRRPELGFQAVGFIDDTQPPGTRIENVEVLGSTKNLVDIVVKSNINHIVVSLAERRNALPVEALLDLRFSGIRVEEAAKVYEVAFGRVSTRQLRPSQLIFSAELGPERWKMRVQTLYSFVLAVLGIIGLAPVLLVVALAVRLTSPGPVLFRQKRVGQNGRAFTIYKFRSMVADAEAKTGAVWASKRDPRVTRIGGFTRRTRLDELPQLFNVARGDMVLVGPRPERPEFVDVLSEQIPFYRQRHAVKPGVTGWAQVNYKYGETVEDTIVKLEYDLYYIKNLSPSLDLFIMFHTVKVMLFSDQGQ